MMYILDSIVFSSKIDEDDQPVGLDDSRAKDEIIIRKAVDGTVFLFDTTVRFMAGFDAQQERWKREIGAENLEKARENLRVHDVARLFSGKKTLDAFSDALRSTGKNGGGCIVVRNMSDILRYVHETLFGEIVGSFDPGNPPAVSLLKLKSRGMSERMSEIASDLVSLLVGFDDVLLFNITIDIYFDRMTQEVSTLKGYDEFYSLVKEKRIVDFFSRYFPENGYARMPVGDFLRSMKGL